jgi:hypothetical protein
MDYDIEIEILKNDVKKMKDEIYKLQHPAKFKIGDKVIYCGDKSIIVNVDYCGYWVYDVLYKKQKMTYVPEYMLN